MTDNEHKLIERGHDNEMLALLEWVRDWTLVDKYFWQHDVTVLLDRFKNRNK